MAHITRRAMLWTASAGFAALSGAETLLTNLQHRVKTSTVGSSSTGATTTRSLTIHIPDATKGEIQVLMGENEFVSQNPDFVRQVLSMTH